ncbi:MAG: four helix bundle protein [Clostridia bacterium]|nr:four helix bundle protein [Clostridia bacterium]
MLFFQIRKSSSSVYANIREANYGQSKADMLSKFEISLKGRAFKI